MDDSMRVEVLKRINDLRCVALDFQFVQSLPSSQQFIHTLVMAQLKQDVYIFGIFKEMQEGYHVLMFDRPVDLDLTHQLLLRSTLLQCSLAHNLACAYLTRFLVSQLVTLGETTLAQEFSLDVFAVKGLSVGFDELFFNDGRHVRVCVRIHFLLRNLRFVFLTILL